VCSTTVCRVHNFPPPSELLVCYQPHKQEEIPGHKSIYETFLVPDKDLLLMSLNSERDYIMTRSMKTGF
jgi:hypothetical protein